MFRGVAIALLALISAFGTTAMAMDTTPMYVALTLEERVELRRQERMLQDGSASSSSEKLRYRYTSSASSRPGSLFERVQDRLQERLDALKQRDPEEYNSVIDMLRRREQRREQRLADVGVSLQKQVQDAVNMERAKRSIPALRYNLDLQTSAQAHAQDMFDRDYFSHENPEGQRSGERIKETGYGVINAQECRCSYRVFLGENIAKGQRSVEQVVQEWMESPSHREAMLSRDYQEVGVGIIDDIWVLNFGGIEINPVE